MRRVKRGYLGRAEEKSGGGEKEERENRGEEQGRGEGGAPQACVMECTTPGPRGHTDQLSSLVRTRNAA